MEPAWIELWFKATENQWDDMLWNQLSASNKDYFSYCYHISEQPYNKELEIAIAKKFKDMQQRLLLIEGMVMNGNLSLQLVEEFIDIINKLRESYQLPNKQAGRMIQRMHRTYNEMKKVSNT